MLCDVAQGSSSLKRGMNSSTREKAFWGSLIKALWHVYLMSPQILSFWKKFTFKFNRKWCVGIVKALHVSDDAKGLLFAHVSLLWFSPAYAVEYCTYLSRAGVEAKARCNNMSTFERVVERPNLVVDFPTLFCFFMYSLECSFIAWVFPIKLLEAQV